MSEELEREAIKKFTEKGCIITSHGFDYISKNKLWNEVEIIINNAKNSGVFLITDEFISECVGRAKDNQIERTDEKEVEEERIEILKSEKIYAKDICSDLKIINDSKEYSAGKIDDFLSYFRSRYKILEKIIRSRIDFRDAVQIENLKPNEDAKIIVMIKEKRETEKCWILEVEDLTGSVTVMAYKNTSDKNTSEIFNRIVCDEVVGIKGKLRKNFHTTEVFYATEVVEPDIPIDHKYKNSSEPVNVVFLSDLHVGSYLFLEKEFRNFIEWLKMKRNRREVAEKVKYVIIAGDLVDGVGVYPNQEKELSIPDIYKQYDYLSKLISQIPEYIEVILAMGNHDAVRSAEPQPKVEKNIAPGLYSMENVHVLGNPGRIEINGVKLLIYHGASMDNLIRNINGLSYTSPEKTMIEFLKKRLLSPIYKEIYPTSKDYLALESVPDIVHAGHVHSNGYTVYRGVYLINSGTFQGRTKYQEELGHIPTPANVPIMNLQTGDIMLFNFGT